MERIDEAGDVFGGKFGELRGMECSGFCRVTWRTSDDVSGCCIIGPTKRTYVITPDLVANHVERFDTSKPSCDDSLLSWCCVLIGPYIVKHDRGPCRPGQNVDVKTRIFIIRVPTSLFLCLITTTESRSPPEEPVDCYCHRPVMVLESSRIFPQARSLPEIQHLPG